MTNKTANLLGILITIIAGTYFYVTLCSECGAKQKEMPIEAVSTTIPDTKIITSSKGQDEPISTSEIEEQ